MHYHGNRLFTKRVEPFFLRGWEGLPFTKPANGGAFEFRIQISEFRYLN